MTTDQPIPPDGFGAHRVGFGAHVIGRPECPRCDELRSVTECENCGGIAHVDNFDEKSDGSWRWQSWCEKCGKVELVNWD